MSDRAQRFVHGKMLGAGVAGLRSRAQSCEHLPKVSAAVIGRRSLSPNKTGNSMTLTITLSEAKELIARTDFKG
jgi:hypothetical protein